MTTHEILEIIDEHLSACGHDSQLLWDVLAALRGPDKLDFFGEVKGETTAHIRRQAFPRTAAVYDEGSKRMGPAFSSPTKELSDKELGEYIRESENWHFYKHIQDARQALRELGRR